MTEQTTEAAPNPVTTSNPAPAPAMIAGKFTDQAAFESGMKNIMSNLDIPLPQEGLALIGEGGMYADVDAAAAAYKQFEKLQGKVGGQKEPAPEPTTPPATTEPAASPDSLRIEKAEAQKLADAKTLLEQLGLDGGELAKTWTESGKLTDDHYAKFKEAGFSPDMVNDYISGKAAQAELAQVKAAQLRSEALTLAGGEESYGNMAKWAAANLNADDLAWFNDQVDGANVNQSGVRRAIEWLNTKYAAGTGTGGSRPTVNGQTAPAQGGGFTNTAEYYAAVEQIRVLAERGEDTSALQRRITATKPEIAYGGY